MVVQEISFVVMFVPLISWPSVIWRITGMTKVLNILFNLYKNNITSKSGLRQSYRENNSEENGAKDAWIFSNPVFNLFQVVPTHLNFHLNFHFHFLLTFHIKMKIIFVFLVTWSALISRIFVRVLKWQPCSATGPFRKKTKNSNRAFY